MSKTYYYENRPSANLDDLKLEVLAVSNLALTFVTARHSKETNIIDVEFSQELSIDDKALLDTVISNHGALPYIDVVDHVIFKENENPTVNDDKNDEYNVAFRWINLSQKRLWTCVDNTVGAAVWLETYFKEHIVYGNEYQYFSEESLSTTTSDEWQSKLNKTTNSLVGGKYRIGWNVSLGSDKNEKAVSYQIKIDDEAVGSSVIQNDRAEFFTELSGFVQLELDVGVHDIAVEYKRMNSSMEAQIARVRVELWRVE